MTTTLLFSNFTAWTAQIAIVVAIGALAALSLSPGRARLVFWQVLLAAVLLLPALQPWHRPVTDPATVVTVTSTTAAYTVAPQSSRSFVWRNDYVLYLILAGAALRWLWIMVGFVRLRHHRLAARPLATPPVPFENLAVRWYVSDTISGPVTFGWLRPAILLPSRVCKLPADLREAIACHELIHVRRADWLFVLAEEAIRGLFWFHPAVWFALSQIQLAREQTVDAEVVSVMSNRERYLDALVAVAAHRLYPDVAPAPLFLKKRQLAVRVAAVLKETRMSKPRLIANFTTVCSAALVAARLAVWFFPMQSAVELNAQSIQSGIVTAQRVMDGPGIEVEAGAPLMHRTGVFRPESVTTTGTVMLDLSLSTKGEVTDARVVSGPDELRKYAIQSALQWHYSLDAGASPTVRATIKFGAAPTSAKPNIIGKAQLRPAGEMPMAPAKIQFMGVPADVEQKVRARLTIHDGDQVTPDSMVQIQAAAREVDEHFMASIGFSKTEALIRLSLGAMMPPPPPPPASGGVAGGIAGGPPGGIVAYRDGSPVYAASADSAPTPSRIRVGGNVQLANLISKVNPMYPPLAKQARIQGVVHFTVVINRDGTIQNIEVISGHPLLVPAALEAVKQWTYKPTLLNNNPVEVITQVDVNFTLAEDPPQQNN
jgi:TonB family protein